MKTATNTLLALLVVFATAGNLWAGAKTAKPAKSASSTASTAHTFRANGQVAKTNTKGGKTFTATLTTYWAIGQGSDYWTRRFTSSTGTKLQDGVTVAVDPRVIPYGSVIEIAGLGRRVAKDTGAHVVQRVASLKRGVNYPVIDIFFSNREDALEFARKSPPFAEVKIISYGANS